MRLQSNRSPTERMNPLAMKSVNAIGLLELVRQHGRISRSTLATVSRLSKPTVSDQIDSLLGRGLVLEVGAGKSSAKGGKRPTMLEFNADFGRILCVDVGAESTGFASADIVGKVRRTLRLPTRPERGARSVLKTIRRGIAELIGSDPQAEGLRMISIAVPGIVDVRNGVVLETDNVFGWRNLALASELTGAFSLPVHVDNDVNMAAIAELKSGGNEGPRNFVLLRLDTGIGAGVVLGGAIHHGAHWAAGEIGHMVLNTPAAAGPASPRGYLESIVGADRIYERIRRAIPNIGVDKWAALEACSQSRRPPLLRTFDDFTLHLGSAVANVAAMYDPEAVILLGKPFPMLLGKITEVTRRLIPWPLEIRLSSLGEDASLQGALAAGLTLTYEKIAFSLQSQAV
ncbi:MAG: ROK family transcriptional regulator [Bryobacteraceae bacterium]|nr:ROK family transcriptional regulator [Bryobacteraceae bacterium]